MSHNRKTSSTYLVALARRLSLFSLTRRSAVASATVLLVAIASAVCFTASLFLQELSPQDKALNRMGHANHLYTTTESLTYEEASLPCGTDLPSQDQQIELWCTTPGFHVDGLLTNHQVVLDERPWESVFNDGVVQLSQGTWPETPGQVALSRELAKVLGDRPPSRILDGTTLSPVAQGILVTSPDEINIYAAPGTGALWAQNRAAKQEQGSTTEYYPMVLSQGALTQADLEQLLATSIDDADTATRIAEEMATGHTSREEILDNPTVTLIERNPMLGFGFLVPLSALAGMLLAFCWLHHARREAALLSDAGVHERKVLWLSAGWLMSLMTTALLLLTPATVAASWAISQAARGPFSRPLNTDFSQTWSFWLFPAVAIMAAALFLVWGVVSSGRSSSPSLRLGSRFHRWAPRVRRTTIAVLILVGIATVPAMSSLRSFGLMASFLLVAGALAIPDIAAGVSRLIPENRGLWLITRRRLGAFRGTIGLAAAITVIAVGAPAAIASLTQMQVAINLATSNADPAAGRFVIDARQYPEHLEVARQVMKDQTGQSGHTMRGAFKDEALVVVSAGGVMGPVNVVNDAEALAAWVSSDGDVSAALRLSESGILFLSSSGTSASKTISLIDGNTNREIHEQTRVPAVKVDRFLANSWGPIVITKEYAESLGLKEGAVEGVVYSVPDAEADQLVATMAAQGVPQGVLRISKTPIAPPGIGLSWYLSAIMGAIISVILVLGSLRQYSQSLVQSNALLLGIGTHRVRLARAACAEVAVVVVPAVVLGAIIAAVPSFVLHLLIPAAPFTYPTTLVLALAAVTVVGVGLTTLVGVQRTQPVIT